MFILYFLIGALSGVMAGLLGIGGGIIVVPALAFVFLHFHLMPQNYIMHMAIGTSLAAIIVTALSAVHAHAKRQTVRWDWVKRLLPGLMVGSILGAIVAHDMSSKYLSLVFGIFLFIISLRMLFTKAKEVEGETPPTYFIILVGSLIGFLSALLGAGGGTMMIPYMMRSKVTIREAAGTSVACGVGFGIVATVSFMLLGSELRGLPWSTGYIYWPAFLGIASASVLFAPVGTALAHRLPTAVLKRVLALCLLFVALYMLILV